MQLQKKMPEFHAARDHKHTFKDRSVSTGSELRRDRTRGPSAIPCTTYHQESESASPPLFSIQIDSVEFHGMCYIAPVLVRMSDQDIQATMLELKIILVNDKKLNDERLQANVIT